MSTTKRVAENTWKQIQRSGWIAWSSIAVMTVAFLVGSIFAGLALVLQFAIQSIETRDNIIVLFEVGTNPELIEKLQEEWRQIPDVKEISYTSEEEAYQKYYSDTENSDLVTNAVLEAQEQKKLDSSLDIRLTSLTNIEEVKSIIQNDISDELAELDYDPTEPPLQLLVDDQTIEQYKEAFSIIRILMISLLVLLFVIIFFFILMTVEYRTYNRMEEIGVMQLVGGSLSYIRAPYIFEGALYGAIGAFVSNIVIGGVWYVLFVHRPDNAFAQLIFEWTRGIDLPSLTFMDAIGMSLAVVGFGFFLGSLISYIAIRRYIK